MTASKAILSSAQKRILDAARVMKAVEVDGKSLRPVETLRDLGLAEFTREHLPGPTVHGHEKIIVWITAKGRQWFWKETHA